MGDFFTAPEQWQARLIVTVSVLAAAFIIRLIVLRIVRRRVDDTEIWYRTQKLTSYGGTFVVFIVITFVWFQVSNIGAWIGVVSAGIAIALADILRNFAGWGYILLRRPFKIGDRIEIDGQAGDVVDVRSQRFSILEIKGWVDADQSTGRIIQIPNGLLFARPLANYTEGFPYIWHEIPMLVTFESDWKRAEEMMNEALAEHAPSMASEEARRAIREASTEYRIRYTHLTPTSYITVKESGVMVTGRAIIPVRSRRHVDTTLWRSLLEMIEADDSVALAYPTVRTYLPDLTITSR
ncbi:MAG: mechanosensitive ion channel [Acidimicrobiia bacterium]|nr:mechanosensitive ion channel family protein [Acidimicrobiia bacterium]MBT8217728.1 mechanosensitive ion channel family protein [Acidimicrobiia bacterium]NNF09549.1 mechanosensitive ion channel [Acidimicrobiia bacterium]NNL71487.1 mechanosensitive ion channel [Acidimicrobiia bacterium]